MRIIAWIILGLIAGALGKLIMPGDDPGGINSDDHNRHCRRPFRWFIGQLLGFHGANGLNLSSILWANISVDHTASYLPGSRSKSLRRTFSSLRAGATN